MFVSLRSRLIGSFQIPCLLVVLLLCAHVAFGQAQSNAADIQGTVKDSTGAVVANATVTARNPAQTSRALLPLTTKGSIASSIFHPAITRSPSKRRTSKKPCLPKVTVTIGQAAQLDVTLGAGTN
jgi:hypothetical protein